MLVRIGPVVLPVVREQIDILYLNAEHIRTHSRIANVSFILNATYARLGLYHE